MAQIVEARNGRWFIKIGQAGFNLPANQVRGYASEAAALAAHARVKAKAAAR